MEIHCIYSQVSLIRNTNPGLNFYSGLTIITLSMESLINLALYNSPRTYQILADVLVSWDE